jgi:uncharacterized protein GlcG (DUF336 family)
LQVSIAVCAMVMATAAVRSLCSRSCAGAGAATAQTAAATTAMTNIIALPGALPIKVGDETIGAAGVSGAPGGDKDEACVKAGLDKVADQLK